MRDGNGWKAALYAHKVGYRVLDGDVFSPTGAKRKLGVRGRYPYWTFNVKVPGDGVARPVRVHVLLAIQIFGADAVSGAEAIRHANGNPLDNRAENILLGTHHDNAMDRTVSARRQHAHLASRSVVKLTPDAVLSIRQERASGALLKDLAAKHGVTKSTIWYCVNNRTHTPL